MRRFLPALCGVLWLAAATATAATTDGDASASSDRPAGDLSSRQCGLSTPYNVQVDGGGVWLYQRHETSDRARSTAVAGRPMPREIFFHDGVLSIDQQVQPVSGADAERLRRMEDGARALMPQVAALTRDSVALTFDVLADVTRVMTDSPRKGRRVERARDQALEQIDGSLGNGRWDQDVFGDAFEANVEQVFAQAMKSIVRSALWAVLTGREDALDARADRVDAQVDRKVEARTAALEARADGMCAKVLALRELQDALEYRYRGAPLPMLAPDAGTGLQVADR